MAPRTQASGVAKAPRDTTRRIRVKGESNLGAPRQPRNASVNKTLSEQLASSSRNAILGSCVVIIKMMDEPAGVTSMRISSLQAHLQSAIKYQTAGLPAASKFVWENSAYASNGKHHWDVAFAKALYSHTHVDGLWLHPTHGIVATGNALREIYSVAPNEAVPPIAGYFNGKEDQHRKNDPARASQLPPGSLMLHVTKTVEEFKSESIELSALLALGGSQIHLLETVRELCTVMFAEIASVAVQRISSKLISTNPPSMLPYNVKFARWAQEESTTSTAEISRFTKILETYQTAERIATENAHNGTQNVVVYEVTCHASNEHALFTSVQSWKTQCRTRAAEQLKPNASESASIYSRRVTLAEILRQVSSNLNPSLEREISGAILARYNSEASAKNPGHNFAPIQLNPLFENLFFATVKIVYPSIDGREKHHPEYVGSINFGPTNYQSVLPGAIVALYAFLKRYEFNEQAKKFADAIAATDPAVFGNAGILLSTLVNAPIHSGFTASAAKKLPVRVARGEAQSNVYDAAINASLAAASRRSPPRQQQAAWGGNMNRASQETQWAQGRASQQAQPTNWYQAQPTVQPPFNATGFPQQQPQFNAPVPVQQQQFDMSRVSANSLQRFYQEQQRMGVDLSRLSPASQARTYQAYQASAFQQPTGAFVAPGRVSPTAAGGVPPQWTAAAGGDQPAWNRTSPTGVRASGGSTGPAPQGW